MCFPAPRTLRTAKVVEKPTLSQDDGRDLTSIIGLADRLRAAVGEKPVCVGKRAKDDRLGWDARPPQPKRDVAREIEAWARSRARGRKEACALGVPHEELALQILTDLIGRLADARPYGAQHVRF